MNEVRFPYPHDTDPDIFREALAHSEATTGFTATLIEKDYYCSLILQYFFVTFVQKLLDNLLFQSKTPYVANTGLK